MSNLYFTSRAITLAAVSAPRAELCIFPRRNCRTIEEDYVRYRPRLKLGARQREGRGSGWSTPVAKGGKMAAHGKSMEASHCRRPRFHNPQTHPPVPLPHRPTSLCNPPHFRASRKRPHPGRRVFPHLRIILHRWPTLQEKVEKNSLSFALLFFSFFLFPRRKKKLDFSAGHDRVLREIFFFSSWINWNYWLDGCVWRKFIRREEFTFSLRGDFFPVVETYIYIWRNFIREKEFTSVPLVRSFSSLFYRAEYYVRPIDWPSSYRNSESRESTYVCTCFFFSPVSLRSTASIRSYSSRRIDELQFRLVHGLDYINVRS